VSLEINDTIYSCVIDLKTKLSILRKHPYIFVGSGFACLLIAVGMLMLMRNASKFKT
jgi:hypothetical protein